MLDELLNTNDPRQKWPAEEMLRALGLPIRLSPCFSHHEYLRELSLQELFDLVISDEDGSLFPFLQRTKKTAGLARQCLFSSDCEISNIRDKAKYDCSHRPSFWMRLPLLIFGFLSLLQASFGKDVSIAHAFALSLPDTAKEDIRPRHPDVYPDTFLPKYDGDSFQLFMYRWPEVNASVPLAQIPEQWGKTKEWASVFGISEGKTDSGIPYVTFNTRMVRDERPPFDSVMTVLRSSTGEAYLFQMTGDTKAIDAIRKSIKIK
ncbi:MAG: hypothetical protein ACOYM3_14975 [Terrimicrobiaceae bacterium]